MWQKAITLIEDNIKPPLAHQLLLDAEYNASAGDYRRCVLYAATACETAKEVAVKHVWERERSETFRRGKALSGYNLGEHLNPTTRYMLAFAVR